MKTNIVSATLDKVFTVSEPLEEKSCLAYSHKCLNWNSNPGLPSSKALVLSLFKKKKSSEFLCSLILHKFLAARACTDRNSEMTQVKVLRIPCVYSPCQGPCSNIPHWLPGQTVALQPHMPNKLLLLLWNFRTQLLLFSIGLQCGSLKMALTLPRGHF